MTTSVAGRSLARSKNRPVSVDSQTPDRSGFPFACGGGAVRFREPSGRRGIRFVGYFGHWAWIVVAKTSVSVALTMVANTRLRIVMGCLRYGHLLRAERDSTHSFVISRARAV